MHFYTHALPRLMDTHINSITLSWPSHNSPIGPCHCERNEDDGEVWKCCLKPAILPTVRSFVCVCLLVKLSAILFICVCACMHFDSILVCQENVSPETNKVSECCFLQIKWWHPVGDSGHLHRFTLDRVDSSSLVIQLEALKWAQE